jgi:predicted alpha/beta superfamily hydrolase
MHARFCLAIGLLLVSCVAAHADGTPPPAAMTAEAVVPMTRQMDFVSAINGHSYRVQIAWPGTPAPANGFRTLYVLDGDAYFGAYASAVRLHVMGGETEPAIVVGISYPDAAGDMAVAMRRREYDLTPTDADADTKAMNGGLPGPAVQFEFGGADTFLQVIETEIKPKVAAIAPVRPGADIIFGHSLGGLFVLHTLFTHPQTFQTYLALSPSIWWNHRAVLAGEAAYVRQVKEGKVAPRLMLAVGGEEQSVPPPPYPPGMTREKIESMVNGAAMVDNTTALAARLSGLTGAKGYEVRQRVYDGDYHISVAWQSINAFLAFALPVGRAP